MAGLRYIGVESTELSHNVPEEDDEVTSITGVQLLCRETIVHSSQLAIIGLSRQWRQKWTTTTEAYGQSSLFHGHIHGSGQADMAEGVPDQLSVGLGLRLNVAMGAIVVQDLGRLLRLGQGQTGGTTVRGVQTPVSLPLCILTPTRGSG